MSIIPVARLINTPSLQGRAVAAHRDELGAGDIPAYNAGNSDHKLHVQETWANLSSLANIATDLRSDGGEAWDDGGITQDFGEANWDPLHSFGDNKVGHLVATADPFNPNQAGGKQLVMDYGSAPPINVHGTNLHDDGKHWYGGGRLANGFDGDVFDAQGDDNADPNNDNTNPGDPRNNRGTVMPSTGYLNSPSRSATVYEWAARMRGTNGYMGKNFDINAGSGTGVGRFNVDHFDSQLGWGGAPNATTNPLAWRYYDAAGDVRAEFAADCPPRYDTTGLNINRDYGSAIGSTGASTHHWKQNKNYGLTSGKFAYGGFQEWPQGSPNADMLGLSTPIWQAGWLRFTLRLSGPPTGQGFGNGRVEMWVTVQFGTPLKVMEYIGDTGGADAGNVYVAPDDDENFLIGQIDPYQLASRTYTGGSIVDIGYIRVWSHTRLA